MVTCTAYALFVILEQAGLLGGTSRWDRFDHGAADATLK